MENGEKVITGAAVALYRHTCYDLLPVSYKVIVLDTSLLVKKALAALLQHGALAARLAIACNSVLMSTCSMVPGVQSAPLWDSTTMRFAGMLTGWLHLN